MMRYIVQLGLCLLLALVFSGPAAALEELSRITHGRYGDMESSTGKYKDNEVKPGQTNQLQQQRGASRPQLRYDPAAGPRNWLALFTQDVHGGVRNYRPEMSCERCHADQAVNNNHVLRGKVQCRQCHGGEPLIAFNAAFSPLNPMRRHAYVCAKCHQGASASFASYVIHEPAPMAAATLTTFPELAWAFWIMTGIAALTFMLFLPHTALWGLRELASRPQVKEDTP